MQCKLEFAESWSWDLVKRINESSSLQEGLQEFIEGLNQKYKPMMAAIWLKENAGWAKIDWRGKQDADLESYVLKLINDLSLHPENGLNYSTFTHGADLICIYPLRRRRSGILLGACVCLVSNKPANQAMMKWIEHFSFLLVLHIERENELERFLRQQTALNLLLGGSNILNNVASESQLFKEAGEMAMGILNVDKGIFVVQDAQNHESLWVRGFGRLKDVDGHVGKSELAEQRNTICGLETGNLGAFCHDCKYFNDICASGIADIPEDMLFSRYSLLINGEIVGELRLLHNPHELDGIDKEILATFVLQISNALETLRHRSTLERLATHDPLTGLLNRSGLERALEAECARAGRSQEKLLFVVLDLDHFKQVNDTFGHPAGDQLLIKLGSVLSESVRAYDMVSRLGGDEFVVVFIGWKESEANYTRIKNWLAGIEKALPDMGVEIGISAGVARFPESSDFRSLYQTADEFLYQAKQTGRHKICGLV